jgi:hypothetical protein
MNLGTLSAMGMLMYVGYIGRAAMFPEDIGRLGFNAGQAHQILASFVEPIVIAILLLLLGKVLGGVGFLLAYKKKGCFC